MGIAKGNSDYSLCTVKQFKRDALPLELFDTAIYVKLHYHASII